MRSLSVVALLIWPSLTPAAESSWCLQRTEGNSETFLKAEPLSRDEWNSIRTIYVHSSHGWPECRVASEECNVAVGDVIELANDGPRLVLQRLRPFGSPVIRDVAEMRMDSLGRFLVGESALPGGDRQVVALFYTGKSSCTDSGLDYPIEASCQFFEYEVYTQSLGLDLNPTSDSVVWTSGPCPTAAQQPGGGGGHDPPPS